MSGKVIPIRQPRNCRNFWVSTQVDGQERDVSCGPREADEGFVTTIRYRENGKIAERAITIAGGVMAPGKIWLTIAHGDEPLTIITVSR